MATRETQMVQEKASRQNEMFLLKQNEEQEAHRRVCELTRMQQAND